MLWKNYKQSKVVYARSEGMVYSKAVRTEAQGTLSLVDV